MNPEVSEPEDIDPDLDPHFDLAAGVHVRVGRRRNVALVVAAGGGIGGIARLGLNTLLPRSGAGFPWATLSENVAGCLLIGVLMALVLEVWSPSPYVRPFLGTGILGGFTTFSAYTADGRVLLQGGHAGTAMAYLVGSLVLGLVAVVAGLALVRRLVGRQAR